MKYFIKVVLVSGLLSATASYADEQAKTISNAKSKG